jgi:hypothetical protein
LPRLPQRPWWARLAALRYLALWTAAAAITAGTLSYLIERFTQVPAIEVLVLVAFCIGWIGGRWKSLLDSALSGAQKLLASKGARK